MTARYSDEAALVRYDLDDSEEVTQGILVAFDALGYDLSDRRPPLNDFISPQSINTLRWSNPQLSVRTSVWGHPVEITSDQVAVYRPAE